MSVIEHPTWWIPSSQVAPVIPRRDYCSAASTIARMTATAALVERALARVAAADPDVLAQAAGRSFFDFATCVHGGRRTLDAAWADPAGRLALEAHGLDRDDLHPPTLTHPGGIVWPVVVVAGTGASGREAVEAAALGYEVIAAVATLL